MEDKEPAIKALEDSVHGRSVPPMETMTIRAPITVLPVRHMRLTTGNGAPVNVSMKIRRMFRKICEM